MLIGVWMPQTLAGYGHLDKLLHPQASGTLLINWAYAEKSYLGSATCLCQVKNAKNGAK